MLARFRSDFARLHALADDDRLGLAVSGGPDSLALLILAHAAFPGRVEAATVDHGLRPESAAEAEMVADICSSLGVPHATLRRSVPLLHGRGIQAAARGLRYTAMIAWCGRRSLSALLTAHHADDQAETLLMRIRRGAGVDGLGSIRPVRSLENHPTVVIDPQLSALSIRRVALVRPLLDFTKDELSSIVLAAGLRPVDDPSNYHEGYDRTHARQLMAASAWLDARRLAASAGHLADAAHALDWAARREFARRAARQTDHGWTLDPSGLPSELLRRNVTLMFAEIERFVLDLQFHVHVDPPRGPELTRFIARLQRGDSATLGRVLARPGPLWRFNLAPPRRP